MTIQKLKSKAVFLLKRKAKTKSSYPYVPPRTSAGETLVGRLVHAWDAPGCRISDKRDKES